MAEVDFRDRAAALVKTIESDPPDVICLQEVALWRRANGRLFDPSDLGTPLVAHDFLDILMSELRRRGLRYSIAASAVNEKVRIPSFRFGRLSLVDRNVILVAGDGIEHLDSESGLFSSQRVVRFMGYSFSFRRGWVSADLKKGGRRLRVINAHLDLSRKVKRAQAAEILKLARSSPLPTILAGDFNINPDASAWFAKAIGAIGFTDVYRATHRRRGPTCCQPKHLRNARSRLTTRLDLVLASRHLRPLSSRRVGADKGSRAPMRDKRSIWISDHAGVLAKLRFRAR